MDGLKQKQSVLFLSLILQGRWMEKSADLFVRGKNVKLWQGESEMINMELTIIRTNVTKSYIYVYI